MAGMETDWSRIERLYEQPDHWERVSANERLNLLFFACLKYGAAHDASRIRMLRGLYERVVGETTVKQRKILFSRLDDAVIEGLGTADTFLPIIYVEPNIGLVSSASMSFIQLHPVKDGDPLTGSKTLREMIDALQRFPKPDEFLELLRCRQKFDRLLPPFSARKVGMLQGLLLLGDRRALPLVDRCWRDLADAEQMALTKVHSGFVYATLVDFFLGWISEASDYILGGVATTLLRMPSMNYSRVIDVERSFPATGPNGGKPIRLLGDWAFPEYYNQIESRLAALFEREDGRIMFDAIAKAWKNA